MTSREKHLRTQLEEFQKKYDSLSSRIAALYTDINRAPDSVTKQVREEERAEKETERERVLSEIGRVEKQIDSLRRGNDRRKTLAWILIVTLAVAAVFAASNYLNSTSTAKMLAIQQATMVSNQTILEKRLQIARSNELAERSYRELTQPGGSWILAGLLAVESLQYDSTNGLALEAGYQALLKRVHLLAEFHHEQTVHVMEFSPNGKYIATGNGGGGEPPSPPGTLRVSEAQTGREVLRLRSSGPVRNLAFTKDSETVIAVIDGNIVVSYDLMTGRRGVEMLHWNRINAMALSSDDSRVATAGSDGTARVWDLVSGEIVTQKVHGSVVTSVTFSPDGEWVASGDWNGTVIVWETDTAIEIGRIQIPHRVGEISFSPDKQWLSVVTEENEPLYRIPQDTFVWKIGSTALGSFNEEGDVQTHAFSPNRRWLAKGTYDGAVHIWNTRPYGETRSYWTDGGVGFVGFSPDGQYVISTETCRDEPRSRCAGQTHVQRTDAQLEIARIEQEAPVSVAAMSYDNSRVGLALIDGTVQIWELTPGEQLVRKYLDSSVIAAEFSPDGKKIAAGGIDGRMRTWNATSAGDPQYWDYGNRIDDVSYSPNGRYLAVGGEAGEIMIWNTATETVTHRVDVGAPILTMEFSPDGQELAVGFMGSEGGSRVGVWQSGTWDRYAEWKLTSEVKSLGYSPNGENLVVGDGSGTATILDIDSDKIGPKLSLSAALRSVGYLPDGTAIVVSGQSDDGGGIAFGWDLTAGPLALWDLVSEQEILSQDVSPDGKWVAYGDRVGVLRILGLNDDRSISPQEVSRLTYSDPIRVVRFSPDGKMLMVASGSAVDVLPWWPDLIGELCNRLTRNLSQDEWHMLFSEESYRPTCPDLP